MLKEIRDSSKIFKAEKKNDPIKTKRQRGEGHGYKCFRGALLVFHVSTIVGSDIDWTSPSSLSGILDSPPIEGRVVWC